MTSSMWEPGLDRHEWESEFATLEAQLREEPREALPELADLVERMLAESDLDPDDLASRLGDERGLVLGYTSARETATKAERGEDVDPSEVGEAIHSLSGVYEFLVRDRSSP
jgi:hypothetical protein